MRWIQKSTLAIVAALALQSVAVAETTDLALLIDTSGSMKSKVAEVKKFAKMVLDKQKNAKLYYFNDNFGEIERGKIDTLKADGGTNLTQAFDRLSSMKERPKAIVLMTDGSPNDPNKAYQKAMKLKKEGVVICSAYIGNGNKPKVLKDISDVSIISDSLKASLDSCLNSAKVKEVLPFSFKENIDNNLSFFKSSSPSKKIEKESNQPPLGNKKAIVIMVDASGENYSCDAIRETNYKKVQELLGARELQEKKVSDIYFMIFSRNSEAIAHTTTKKRGTDKARYRRLAKVAKMGLKKLFAKMPEYYKAIEHGKEVHYGKDIQGAIESAINLVKQQERERGVAFRDVEIVIASDMMQSVNKEKVQKKLDKNPISLPINVKLQILAKNLSCENYPQSEKNRFEQEVKNFWKRGITPVDRIDYFTNY